MRTSELAGAAGVNSQTLRYYERRGLLPAPERRASGYRDYAPDAVRRVRFIKRAQDLGFTLIEVEDLLALRERAGRSRPEARTLAAAKIAGIETKLRHLTAMRDALQTLISACESGRRAVDCPIIEALEEDGGEPGQE